MNGTKGIEVIAGDETGVNKKVGWIGTDNLNEKFTKTTES